MSVIAVRINDGKIEVASDSIIIKDDLKRTNFKKLIRTHNMIIGGCGTAEELSMFFDYAQEHEIEEATTQGVRDFMFDFSRTKGVYTGESKIENAYIIVVDKRVFEIDGMFVSKVQDYTAIGEGESYALAALALGHTVEEAVGVAAKLSCFVAEPVIKFVV